MLLILKKGFYFVRIVGQLLRHLLLALSQLLTKLWETLLLFEDHHGVIHELKARMDPMPVKFEGNHMLIKGQEDEVTDHLFPENTRSKHPLFCFIYYGGAARHYPICTLH